MKKVFNFNLHWDIIKRGKYLAFVVKKHLPKFMLFVYGYINIVYGNVSRSVQSVCA